MRLARRMLAAGLFDAGPTYEAHYLLLDGLVDYGLAKTVFGGISDDYSIAIKLAYTNVGAVSSRYYYAAGGPGASNDTRRDEAHWQTTNVVLGGRDASNNVTYSAGLGVPADSSTRVIGIKRDQSATDAFMRMATATAIEGTAVDINAAHQIPDHLAIGASIHNADYTEENSNRCAAPVIGVVIVAGLISDEEMIAWCADVDAETTIANIDHYWVASDIANGGAGGVTASIAPRVGSVSLDLYGPVRSDLVAWSPP